jgi:tetratricopeptide (TPR) repeat protein
VLNELLKREPHNAAVLRYRAEISLARKDHSGAISDLRAAIMVESRLQDRLRLAELYARTKQYDEASAHYQQILKDEPASNEARTGLAVILLESGKASEAIAQLEALLETEPKNAAIRAQLAELYLPKQPEQALEQYAAAAKLAPNNLSYQLGMGAALVKLRRFQEAVPALRRVLSENPKDDLAYFAHTNLATALFELDDFANAAREFVWILGHQRQQKRVAVTLYFLGICFDKLGDYEQALKAYEQFLSLATTENQLEIDKVKLRLPSLQRQIKDGKGIRKKQ